MIYVNKKKLAINSSLEKGMLLSWQRITDNLVIQTAADMTQIH